jgi:hypothetical protein
VRTHLNILLTALHVWIDDHLDPRRRPGRRPRLTDAELAHPGRGPGAAGRPLRGALASADPQRLPKAFPCLPAQSGYNKRLRGAVPLLCRVIRDLAAATDLWTDPVWLVDSTPVECARSGPAARRSDLAGAAGYGYCASHSRYFWGLRLLLVCTPAGLPITWALAHPELDERQVLMAVLDHDAHLLTARPGLLLIADRGQASAELDDCLHARGVELVRPAYRNRAARPGQQLLAPIRQLIEWVHDTLKGQLDLELHGGRSMAGVTVRVAQRLLALTAAIWHNRATGQPVTRSLVVHDH